METSFYHLVSVKPCIIAARVRPFCNRSIESLCTTVISYQILIHLSNRDYEDEKLQQDMDKHKKTLKSILYRSFEPLVHFINEGSKGKFQLCSSPNARLYDLKNTR